MARAIKCTSGRAIKEIGLVRDEPCGAVLALLGDVKMCPKCDRWPGQKAA